MMDVLLVAAAVFSVSFFRVFQQKNSAGMHYRWVPLSQYGIHLCESIVMGVAGVTAVESGSIPYTILVVGVPAGTGGTMGAILSMYLHNRYVKAHQQCRLMCQARSEEARHEDNHRR